MDVKVYELKIEVKLLSNIPYDQVQSTICLLLDSTLAKSPELLEYHKRKEYKNYTFNHLYPIESDRLYKAGSAYTITMRTPSSQLLRYFTETLTGVTDYYFQVLQVQSRLVPIKMIEKIYTITPCILKNDGGYWRTIYSVDEFESRLKANAIKKYEAFTGDKLEHDFEMYHTLTFSNAYPIVSQYKSIKLLGDKITLQLAGNEMAQRLAYFLLGTGILENNGRGFGYLNYRWI